MKIAAVVLLAAASTAAVAADPSFEVNKLLRERDQRDSELRLKMQQQQERALRPPTTPSADFRLRQHEVNEQTRLREELELERREREARDAAPPTEASRAQRATEGVRP